MVIIIYKPWKWIKNRIIYLNKESDYCKQQYIIYYYCINEINPQKINESYIIASKNYQNKIIEISVFLH